MRFGRFELRVDADVLMLDGRPVHVQPQPLRVLRILVQHAGEVVSRDSLREALWGASTFVEFDQGLNYCIRQLRIALRDDAARPIYIETIKKQGYRFRAPVEVMTAAAAVPARQSAAAPAASREASPTAASDGRPDVSAGSGTRRAPVARAIGLGAVVMAGLLLIFMASTRSVDRRASSGSISYTQLTNFSDAAFGPTLSPDGRMVAFIVGSDSFFPPVGEVYVKLLPDGEPRQLTHDRWRKYGPAFSPDGTQIAFTVNDAAHGWATRTVSPLGGDSRLLLGNASGLVWLDPRRLMFAEIVRGLHMQLVTADADRSFAHTVYLPEHERGMAHFGVPSPDRRTAIVVEMGGTGWWQQCRLVPMDGHDAGVPVGPDGACTAAAWSPDGTQMYFTARVNGESHIWRQSSDLESLEQLTRGPTDEQGLALSADGRALVTSVGMIDSGVWLRDGSGDHLLLQEGVAARLAFSPDGRSLYYLLRRADGKAVELRAMDMESRVSRPVVTGLSITSYDLSADGSRVVMAVRDQTGAAQLWIASTDGQGSPLMLPASGDEPSFGPDDTLYFRGSENGHNYLFRMALDGSSVTRARTAPVLDVKGSSPDKRWVLAMVPIDGFPNTAVVALSSDLSREVRVCPAECLAAWSPDGSRFYVEPILQDKEIGSMIEVPVTGDSSLPGLPPSGVMSADDVQVIPGAKRLDIRHVDLTTVGASIAPGPAAGSFVYARSIVRRNLFEVKLP